MSVFGIAMVRDEDDIIGYTISHMLRQVDHVIVADNGSTDGTRGILNGFGSRVTVKDDDDPAYYQSRKMSALAAEAASEGAEWVVPFDADEVWYCPFAPRIADELAERPESVVTATLYDHVATEGDPEGNPVEAMGYRRKNALPLPKVACRTHPDLTIHQGNHGVDHGETIHGRLVIRHYPYRSAEQFIRKVRNGAAAYAATDLPEDIGQHWRDYGRLSDEELDEVFHRYFFSADPIADTDLTWDPISSSLGAEVVSTASAP